jgi:hypothetical protein
MAQRFPDWLRTILGPRLPVESAVQSLSVCPHCRACAVVPVDTREHDEHRWWLALRCGECGSAREVVVPDAQAERYGCELDRACAEIEAELNRLERERMDTDARTLAIALARDLIDAGDFER